jgi:hypothetical protein
MPQSIMIGLLVLGGVLLLIAITGGQFKIFAAEVDSPVSSKPVRLMAGLLGLMFIAGALLLNKGGGSSGSQHPPDNPSGSASPMPAATNSTSSGQQATQAGSNPAVSSYEYAIVFDPPTNIRVGPATASDVQCSVTSKTSIRILGSQGNWYRTDICGNGLVGYIYRNQVQF